MHLSRIFTVFFLLFSEYSSTGVFLCVKGLGIDARFIDEICNWPLYFATYRIGFPPICRRAHTSHEIFSSILLFKQFNRIQTLLQSKRQIHVNRTCAGLMWFMCNSSGLDALFFYCYYYYYHYV